MPTYGYRCPKGHEFEAIHGMGAPPPTACEICGAKPVSRVFYPISTSFTGSGFYSTDYGRGRKAAKEGGSSEGSSSEGGSSGSGSSDSGSSGSGSSGDGSGGGGSAGD